MRMTVVSAVSVAGVLLSGCTSSGHKASSPTPTSPASPVSSSPSVIAPLLPGVTVSSSPAPWAKDYAASQFQSLLDAFNRATVGGAPPDGSSFAQYVQYSQRIADACDPFLNGLRSGQWPVNAQLTIVQFTRLQQTVCDVELARGQAGTIQQYKGVLPPPANAAQQLLDYRLKIYKLLGI